MKTESGMTTHGRPDGAMETGARRYMDISAEVLIFSTRVWFGEGFFSRAEIVIAGMGVTGNGAGGRCFG